MALIHDSFVDDLAFLPEREAHTLEAEELLRWAAWLDDGGQPGTSREQALDALLEAADQDVGTLTAAWVCGLRAQRDGTVTRRAVELLRATIDRVDDDASPITTQQTLTLLG